ncbi:sarcosine oxidase subunit beta family protein [Sphingomonas sp. CGMCC 1.13654]|uniref:Sarcosine oxidase subunit beta family protein n=1 Tax=Sphingomonas chungangi TaxID=2683589 RepID=A0A838L4A2_9SPHN|nr:sarcosine oxidase subunit beta family protein [Sphingomonas chungangi]MBA2933984.1 sarcosine oxidase subunit beta family protein [Sphingomonas chungangi]MVW57109.1 sarcosine oxidase subunit beta family protein [Sphingomonas chungangi]
MGESVPFKKRFSAAALFGAGLRGQRNWPALWRSPEPRKTYQVLIIGGGGHGLATAYHLARDWGIRDVAVIEKGWIGGGNTGRNTTVVRSNYYYPASARFYQRSVEMYQGLSDALNFNIMFSQRGIVTLAFSPHELNLMARQVNAMQLNGIAAEILTRDDIARLLPHCDLSATARFPCVGGFLHASGGTARHDAVAWGYARAADTLGVDILQNVEVLGFEQMGGRVCAVQTNAGRIGAEKVAIAVAGNSTVVAGLAGIDLPVRSQTLQAFVSEPLKPVLDIVVMSGLHHTYVSQSDKGELVIGGDSDTMTSYAQRGSFATIERTTTGLLELFPAFSRVRLMRQWGGTVDLTPDRSPIIDRTSLDGLYISTGWGTGGFKAIPAGGAALAHFIAHDAADEYSSAFTFDRFRRGALLDEGAASGVAH